MTSQQINRELLIPQTASQQEQTEELAIIRQKEPECVNTAGFLERGTGQHQSNTVYDSNGLAPTEYSVQYKDPFKVVECQKLKE